jgi:aerobic carbon-monoxide dehydrogenase medium subunit
VLLPPLEYQRADSVEHAVELLSADRNARVLAGGQTLLNALKLRIVRPDVLVDVTRIEELHAIERGADGSLAIGAACTYDELATAALVREAHPVVASMTASLVDRQVRARGTIGGNVCLADPTSNFPPLLVALGARLRIRGAEPREVDAESFFLAPYLTDVAPGELLEAVVLPPLADDEGVGYESLQVGTDSWALARACALVRCNGSIAAARIALGCGPVPVRQPAMEQAVVGCEPTEAAVGAAAELAGEGFDPPGDVHASAEFRTQMAKVMARRAVLAATGAQG